VEKTRGFTLIELLIAIAILAILVGVAGPSLRDLMMNAAMTSQTNDLMAALAVARNEAARRSARTVICTSSNGTACTDSQWHEGWIVIIDADADGDLDAGTSALNVQAVAGGDMTITSVGHGTNASSARFVSYVASGALAPTIAIPVIFTLCDSRTVANVGEDSAHDKGRTVSLSPTGRAIAQRFTCP
jgi:type IV fimbrial biogenesis protein FimT